MHTRGSRWAVALAAVAVALLFGISRTKFGTAPRQGYDAVSLAKVPAIVRALRPNYPYSVIPGGIYSADELRNSLKNDRLLQEHYAGFNLHAARLVVARTDHLEYASYRLKGQIFWTKKRLLIPKGEILMSDGVHLSRTRCGNRLSEIPVARTAEHEPAITELSLPPFSMELMKQGQLTFAIPPSLAPLDLRALPEMENYPSPRLVIPPLTAANWPVFGSTRPFGTFLIPAIPIAKSLAPAPGTTTSGTTSASPTPVQTIGGSTGGGVSAIPEPRALVLFEMLLFGSGWGLLRLRRQSHASVTNGSRASTGADAVLLGEREKSRERR